MGDPERAADAPSAGTAHQQQRAAGPHLRPGLAGDRKGNDDVVAEGLVHLVLGQFQHGSVARAAGGNQHVIDRRRYVGEEPLQRSRIVDVEGGAVFGAELGGGPVKPSRVTSGEDHLRTLGPSAPRRLESDAGAAADQHHSLAEQLRLA
jgi:hypothetical protein